MNVASFLVPESESRNHNLIGQCYICDVYHSPIISDEQSSR